MKPIVKCTFFSVLLVQSTIIEADDRPSVRIIGGNDPVVLAAHPGSLDCQSVSVPVSTNGYLLLYSIQTSEVGAILPTQTDATEMKYRWMYFGKMRKLDSRGAGEVFDRRLILPDQDGQHKILETSARDILFASFHLVWLSVHGHWISFNPRLYQVSFLKRTEKEILQEIPSSVTWCTNALCYNLLEQKLRGKTLTPGVERLLDAETVPEHAVPPENETNTQSPNNIR